MVRVRSALAVTTRTAVATEVLVPTEVVKEPAAIVLVIVPPNELVTTTVTVQVDACGINVLAARVKEPEPGVAVATAPLQPQVKTEEGGALTKPDGYRSVNSDVSVAETSAWVLVMVIVNKAVPPALIELTEKLFAMVGLDWATVSMSAAVHVWFTQDGDEFVFVTLEGGEITAVLVTWVWAWATVALKTNRKENATSPAMRRT